MKPSYDDIYMELAEKLALRSHCVKAQVGAVLTKDTRIVSLGYNGPPAARIIATRNFLVMGAPEIARAVAHWHYTPNKMLFYMQ